MHVASCQHAVARLAAGVLIGATLFWATSLWAIPASADQTDPRLAPLFNQLKATTDADAAQPLEAQIWDIWTQSGDAQADGLMQTGVAALATADYDQALAAFDEVVKHAPDFAEGWNKRATTLYAMGRFADSVADIARVLKLEPRHFGALSGLGLCDAQLDRPTAALDAFQKALAINPSMPGVQLNIRALQQQIAKRSI